MIEATAPHRGDREVIDEVVPHRGDRKARTQLALSVAPMMERTDRHFRYLMRLVSPNARLYTEMITSAALIRGDARRLLAFDPAEHPVAAQLGGSEPEALAEAARLVEEAGYDEVNLNVGCPSSRVQAGCFGARLMLEPARVADCVAAMRAATALPVTVKTRIGVDDQDDYEVLHDLTARLLASGLSALIVHARKAWLSGLSPKENREIPPLDYPRVYRLKRDFPALDVAINGGFTTEDQVLGQGGRVDGVMLGRVAYDDPMLVGRLDARLYGNADGPAARACDRDARATASSSPDGSTSPSGSVVPDVAAVLERYASYMRSERRRGTPLRAMSRHLMGLVRHRRGARQWRRRLSELANDTTDIDELLAGLTTMPATMPGRTRYNARLTPRADKYHQER